VIGGMHSPAGAIVGGLFLQFFPDLVAGLGKGLSGLLYAVLLIAAMVLMPTGIVGAVKRLITSSPAKLGRWRRHTATEGS
jgi:branched-chain amino acid transport system permease protein